MTCRIVLVGVGHAHVGVLRDFSLRPTPGVRLTLLTRGVEAPYSGMLPGHVAGPARPAAMAQPASCRAIR